MNLWKKVGPILLTIIFFIFLLVGVRKHSQSWYFQDETDHVATGWMITNYDRQLYTNLTTNHQPLPVLTGAALAEIIPHQTLFQFIDRLRISMWLFAFVSSLMIVMRFKWSGLATIFLTYSLGHYFFAWHVLTESLVIPSIIWLLLSLVDTRQSRGDALLFGLGSFLIIFNLLPLWPFVLLINGSYWWQFGKKHYQWQLLGLFIPTLLLFLIINPFAWWQETIINNLVYFIPYETNHGLWHYLALLFYPILHFQYPMSVVARFYWLPVLLIAVYTIVLLRTKKYLPFPHLIRSLFFLLLVWSLNPRISTPDVAFFEGFHLFPFIAGLSVLVSLILTNVLPSLLGKKGKGYLKKWSLLLVGCLLLNNLAWLSESKNKLNDYYIHYDTFQAYGTALKIISQPGNTLLTGPDGSGYMNMMADIPFAGRQNFHLEWAYRTPYLREAWHEMIEENPPTFIYYKYNDDSYSKVLLPLVEKEYLTLQRADGTPTLLKMRREAAEQITDEQWQAFIDQAFLRPTIE